MTLKRQSVQSLSGHKTARTFCVTKNAQIVERMAWSKTNGRSLLSRGGGGVEWQFRSLKAVEKLVLSESVPIDQ